MSKIVVMGGSFNPPTIAHQRLLLGAVKELGADRGIFVPSSHAYVKTKMKRAKHPEETLVEHLRLKMLAAMAEDDPRLSVDDLEYHRKGKGYTYELNEICESDFWIDMETGIRTNDRFDIARCESVCAQLVEAGLV